MDKESLQKVFKGINALITSKLGENWQYGTKHINHQANNIDIVTENSPSRVKYIEELGKVMDKSLVPIQINKVRTNDQNLHLQIDKKWAQSIKQYWNKNPENPHTSALQQLKDNLGISL